MPAIALENVWRFYAGGRRLFGGALHSISALSDLSLTVDTGEIFGLVGESGSGKTTVARLMMRLEKPDRGIIRYKDQDVTRLRGKQLNLFRRKVQMIFQDPYQSLNPYQSVHSAVAEPLHIHRWGTRNDRRQKVLETLSQVGLTPPETYLNRHPHQLSGGQRQRVAIARAMVLDPEILIADEPTSMLDASIAIQIYHILSEIQKRRSISILFITHNLAAAHYLCNRIAVIYRGRIVEIGPAQAIIANPYHPYTQALLEALPRYGHMWTERRYNTLRDTQRPGAAPDRCPFYARCAVGDDAQCSQKPPVMQEVGEGHSVACFIHE